MNKKFEGLWHGKHGYAENIEAAYAFLTDRLELGCKWAIGKNFVTLYWAAEFTAAIEFVKSHKLNIL